MKVIIYLVGALLICGILCAESAKHVINLDNDYIEQDDTLEVTDKNTKNEKLFITTLNGILGHRDTSSNNTLIFAKSTPSTLHVWKVYNVSEFSSTLSQQYEEIEEVTTKSVSNKKVKSTKVIKRATTVATKVKPQIRNKKNKASPKKNSKRKDNKKLSIPKVAKSAKIPCPLGKKNCSPKTRSNKPQNPKPKIVKSIKKNNLSQNKGVKPKLPSKTSTNKALPKKTNPKKKKIDPKNTKSKHSKPVIKPNSKQSKSSSKPGYKKNVSKSKKDSKTKQANKGKVSDQKLKGPVNTNVALHKSRVKNYVDPYLLNNKLDIVGMVKRVFFN